MTEQTATTPQRKSPVPDMAKASYRKINLYQSPNPSRPWPNLWVSLNGYSVVLPRDREIIVSEQLLHVIDDAASGYRYEQQHPITGEMRTYHYRRDDLAYRTLGSLTAEEAHALRVQGVEVYPTKIPVETARELLGEVVMLDAEHVHSAVVPGIHTQSYKAKNRK